MFQLERPAMTFAIVLCLIVLISAAVLVHQYLTGAFAEAADAGEVTPLPAQSRPALKSIDHAA
jgi:hypothetical protein